MLNDKEGSWMQTREPDRLCLYCEIRRITATGLRQFPQGPYAFFFFFGVVIEATSEVHGKCALDQNTPELSFQHPY